jgi:uncharacterized membrane protein YfcA
MSESTVLVLAVLILVVGFLYSSVGHAGASGYLAVMALMCVAPDVMKPTALALNIVVAIIGTVQFALAGHFRWRLFWPFAVASIPLAYLGGRITLPPEYYRPLVGLVLLFSAWRLWMGSLAATEPRTHEPRIGASIAAGGLLGFVSGLTGTGGGIFLSPLMLLMKWADPKKTAATSAAFILVNSISGITGALRAELHLPAALAWWCAAAGAGGLAGSYLGSRKLEGRALRRLLAVVLVLAGGKLLLGG